MSFYFSFYLFFCLSIYLRFQPALSPKMVTLFGFPPNSAMLFWTHCSAALWSQRAKFPKNMIAIICQPTQGSNGIRQCPINWCTFPMTIHKIVWQLLIETFGHSKRQFFGIVGFAAFRRIFRVAVILLFLVPAAVQFIPCHNIHVLYTMIQRYNKDDNIHKSEALKRLDKRTITFVEYQN